MTEHGEALWNRLQQGKREEDTAISVKDMAVRVKTALASLEAAQVSLNTLHRVIAFELRQTVEDFNAAGVSTSSLDGFRERVLMVADTLDPRPDATAAGDGLLASVVGLVRR